MFIYVEISYGELHVGINEIIERWKMVNFLITDCYIIVVGIKS